jgi:hypothetical protein
MNTEPKQKKDERLQELTQDYKNSQKGMKSLFMVQNDGAYVALSPSETGVGRIVDISMGGLMFEYATVKGPTTEPTELEIFVPGGVFRLGGLPCKTIWDRPCPEVFDTPLHKRRCGVQFGDLTRSQRAELKHFLQNHVAGEA